MADVVGVSIEAITGCGWSDDGRYIWLTHKLSDGTEYRLVYPFVAAGHLITSINHAIGSAAAKRAERNPNEVKEGMDGNAMPVEEVRIGTADAKVIMHLTTADQVAIVVEMPAAVLGQIAEQSQCVLDSLETVVPRQGRLH
jgi:hypothetical protein